MRDFLHHGSRISARCITFLTRILVFLYLLSLGAPTSVAAVRQESQVSKELVERMAELERKISIQEKTMEITGSSIDKRLSDFGVLATMQGSQTSWVSNTVALMSVLITLIIAAAGALTYISVTRRITREAEEAASRWLTTFRSEIDGEISELDRRIKGALKNIAEDEQAVRQQRHKATSAMDDDAKATRKAADALMRVAEATSKNERDQERKSKLVQKASEDLKLKPESEFGAEDYYIRGVSLYSEGNFKGALNSFESALALTGSQDHQNLIRFHVSKAQALEKSGEIDAALDLYRKLDNEYRDVELAAADEHLSKMLVNMSLLIAKKIGPAEAIELSDELSRRYGNNLDKNVLRNVAQGHFNKSFWLGGMRKHEESIAAAQEMLALYKGNNSPDIQPVLDAAELNMAGQLDALLKFDDALLIFESISSRHAKSKNRYFRLMAIRAYSGKIVTLKRSGRADLALEVYKDIERYAADNHGPVKLQVVSMLRYKANLLRSLGRNHEADSTLDHVVEAYHKDKDPSIRLEVVNSILQKVNDLKDALMEEEQASFYQRIIDLFETDKHEGVVQIVSGSRNSLGYSLLLCAKKQWADAALRTKFLNAAYEAFLSASKKCEEDISAIVTGNIAYVKFLKQDVDEFERLMEIALTKGGESLFEGQLADGEIYQVDVDSEYKDRLIAIWQRLSTTKVSSPEKVIAMNATGEM